MCLRPAVFTLFLFFLPTTTMAQWTTDGVPISAAAGDQAKPKVVSDGAGGAIVTWRDHRPSIYQVDVYAQRIDASGMILWTADGVALCNAANDQDFPAIVSDGAGGAIVAWDDFRTGIGHDIFAQRIDASGAVQWTPNGVPVYLNQGNQSEPAIVSDGAGGAIVTWRDARVNTNHDIYAQRIDAAGVAQWSATGVALCTSSGAQFQPAIVSDGAGGAIVTWRDARVQDGDDIYAQRIDASGAVQWTTDGVALCTAASYQRVPMIISDAAGGAIVTWRDARGDGGDIYAQRIDASGAVQWTADGVALCTANDYQESPMIVPDDAGGAIVTWLDARGGATYDIYSQRIDASGTVQWAADGVLLSTDAAIVFSPNPIPVTIAPDGAGGAIAVWENYPSASLDIHAQRIDAWGTVQWTATGVPVCSAAGNQRNPTIVSDGTVGAIVTWYDHRGGTDDDIYAQHVPVPSSTGIGDAPAISALTVLQNQPNPFTGATDLRVQLPADADVSIDVYDVAGRRVRSQELVHLGAGWRTIHFDGRGDDGRPLASGVYFYRVTANGTATTRKLVITR